MRKRIYWLIYSYTCIAESFSMGREWVNKTCGKETPKPITLEYSSNFMDGTVVAGATNVAMVENSTGLQYYSIIHHYR
jgi:hypothetical protein